MLKYLGINCGLLGRSCNGFIRHMKKSTWWILGVIVVLIIVLAVTSNKRETATDSGPVRVGAALMLTGPASLLGELQQKVLPIAVGDVNKNGGINGRPLELVIEDAAYDPKTAVSAYQALKQKGLKLFIIDGSSPVASTRPLVIADGNFTIAGVATAPSYYDGNNRSCRIAPTAKLFGPANAELAIKRGYKNVAVLAGDNEYGRGLADEFTKTLIAKGGKVVLTEFYNASPAASDYKTNITKVKAIESSVDAIVFTQALNTLPAMLKQMSDLGLKKPLISDYPTVDNPALKGDLSVLNGLEYAGIDFVNGDSSTDSPKAKAFKDAYKAKFDSYPIFLQGAHYDVVMLLSEAIAKVGQDPQKVADYISGLKDYEGVTGVFSFNSDCEVERKPVFNKIVDGKIIRTE